MASPLARRVTACNRRAREKGVAGTLSVADWKRTLNHFQGRCAYCRQAAASTIDHFIPLAFGGGTTYSNCVPACVCCNGRKGSTYPEGEAISFIEPALLEQVRSYLEGIGKWHQESFKKLWERVPQLAHAELAVASLKQYCQEHALQLDDPYAFYYGSLRFSIFGVEWDPANYYQVIVSLNWQKRYTSDPLLKMVCDAAAQFLSIARERLEEENV